MRDTIFIAVTLTFFGLCLLYVYKCNRIVGDDSSDSSESSPR